MIFLEWIWSVPSQEVKFLLPYGPMLTKVKTKKSQKKIEKLKILRKKSVLRRGGQVSVSEKLAFKDWRRDSSTKQS